MTPQVGPTRPGGDADEPLVLLVASESPTGRAVADVLRDWTALGLVRPHLWIDAGEVDPGAPFGSVVATVVTGEGVERVRLADHLANLPRLGLLRLVAVDAVTDRAVPVPPAVAGHLYTSLEAVRAGRVAALQVVLTRHGWGAWQPGLSLPGWQTLVVAPEDAWNPSSPPTELLADSDEAEFEAHAAAGLAGPAALWTGMTEGPFDQVEAPVTGSALVVRSFLRRLDAGAVTGAVRVALTDVSRGLPRPRSGTGRCVHLEAPQEGAATLARGVLGRHEALLALELEQAVAPRARSIGPWAALRQFFSFLAAALRRAPGALVDATLGRGAARVSGMVQQALYGEQSQFEVVTRGVNARGLPPGVDDLSQAARHVQQRVAPVLGSEFATPDLRPLWRDVVDAGLTLADAGERVPGVGPLQVGGTPAVVPQVAAVAPAAGDGFAVPAGSSLPGAAGAVSPYDVRAQDQLAERVEEARAAGREVGVDAQALADWRDRVERTYTGVLGRRLADEVQYRTDTLRDLLARLSAPAADDEEESQIADGQRIVRRLLVTFLLGLLVIAVVATVLAYADLVRPLVLTGLVFLAVLAWVVRTVVAVVNQQRRVFALLNARRRREDELEVAARNLPRVAAGLQTATVLYRQYLAWAPVLARFLREPFGPTVPAVRPPELGGLLPRAVGIGSARPDDDAIAETAFELGAAVYEQGWLGQMWQAFVADAPRRLGRDGFELRDDPWGALAADPARPGDSPLVTWSELVTREGLTAASGDALWRRARSTLLERGVREVSGTLFATVDVQAQQGHGVTEPRPGHEFLTGLTGSLRDVAGHHFAPGLFTPRSRSDGEHRVTTTAAAAPAATRDLAADVDAGGRVRWLDAGADVGGLDQFVVVVQASAPVAGSSLQLKAQQGGPPSRSGPPGSGPGDDGDPLPEVDL